jgi:hypothetical protein
VFSLSLNEASDLQLNNLVLPGGAGLPLRRQLLLQLLLLAAARVLLLRHSALHRCVKVVIGFLGNHELLLLLFIELLITILLMLLLLMFSGGFLVTAIDLIYCGNTVFFYPHYPSQCNSLVLPFLSPSGLGGPRPPDDASRTRGRGGGIGGDCTPPERFLIISPPCERSIDPPPPPPEASKHECETININSKIVKRGPFFAGFPLKMAIFCQFLQKKCQNFLKNRHFCPFFADFTLVWSKNRQKILPLSPPPPDGKFSIPPLTDFLFYPPP